MFNNNNIFWGIAFSNTGLIIMKTDIHNLMQGILNSPVTANNSSLSIFGKGKNGSEIQEGHLMSDHVHMLISIPPKYSVAHVVGYIKGKSAIHIARRFRGKEKNFTGEHFWARGYFVSTVGRDEITIREYIKNQEKEDVKQEQLQLFR